MRGAEFADPQGYRMVPLRCGSCGDQIGFKSPDFPMENVVARCYACAAIEEADAILRAADSQSEPPS